MEIEVNGLVKLYLNNIEIEKIKNTWLGPGLDRTAALLSGNEASDAYRATLTSVVAFTTGSVRDTLTTESKGGSLNVLYIKAEKEEGDKTISSVLLVPTYQTWTGIDWSSVPLATPLTVPSGWTFRVEWNSTFTGTDYTSTYLNSIPSRLNAFTINSDFAPNSISVVHSGGESFAPSTSSWETVGGTNVVCHKGSFITGAMTSIGTIRIYRAATMYASSAISSFNKPSDVELHIEHRNTITQ